MIEQVLKVFADFEKNGGFNNFRHLFLGNNTYLPFAEIVPKNKFMVWVENNKNWELLIPSTQAEITISEKNIEIEYTNNFKNQYGCYSKKGYFTLPYPENTIFESITANKNNEKGIIIVTIDKFLNENVENKENNFGNDIPVG